MHEVQQSCFGKPVLAGFVLLLAGLGLVALAGCSSDSDDSPAANPAATTASQDSPQATPDTADPMVDNTATDLIGCESNVAADVPVFYSTYFRCTDISIDGDFVVITGTG